MIATEMSQENLQDEEDVEGKVFIGGLSWQTSESTLRAHFEKFGELTDVALMIDKRTAQPRGFGFIKMKYPAAVDIVIAQEHIIDGRKVDVKKAVPRDRAPAPTRSESKKIFVGGLSAEVTDKLFHDYFSKFGTVKDAVVMVDRSTNRSRGFGFVTFETDEAVDKVVKTENTILGKWVEVKRAEPRDLNIAGRFEVGRGGFRGGPGRGMDSRMGRGYGRGGPEDYYGMPYGRGGGYGGGYPGYGPAPGPYGMQGGYPGGGYGGYPGGGYPGYGPTGPSGYSSPQGYGGRAPGAHDNEVVPGANSTAPATGYGTTGASTTAGATATAPGYDSYGRSQQYSYGSSAMAGYGGAYGVYNNTAQTSRTGTTQESYEGGYGAYRPGVTQNRVERGYKPY
mmetsp:Transcript_22278/g.20249  ORF Transcript_22278/g.20249 Transcript_22278/m.20249 type:complete len:394 (-) Transcript_22278:85-1266(-)|eukprot:CAMPEP_0196761428 /NCGR_PEP_ID=MMETSP1095-20130614/668_1 /TAXON_ID=96789 ORGANISM="Chromulina nebulosa, Strain UTEXLB2642" /NCGR_SAMPLE_ID=MMETSP1095 /ASSEMBLY_ACC=CAM_ASM_000446 /LENGTH=393 /DNA_ID=CAMNT_0042110981 /DNA_START=209 /DNA_END=1390 /DNA_ORIENTATION=+